MKNRIAGAEREAVLVDADLLQAHVRFEEHLVARLERLLRDAMRQSRQAKAQRRRQLLPIERRRQDGAHPAPEQRPEGERHDQVGGVPAREAPAKTDHQHAAKEGRAGRAGEHERAVRHSLIPEPHQMERHEREADEKRVHEHQPERRHVGDVVNQPVADPSGHGERGREDHDVDADQEPHDRAGHSFQRTASGAVVVDAA